MAASVSSYRNGDGLIVVVSGEVDLATAPLLTDAVDAATASDGAATVTVELSEVTFLDSSGIAALLKGRRVADERGRAYRVVGATGTVLEVLELTGVWTHLSGEQAGEASLT